MQFLIKKIKKRYQIGKSAKEIADELGLKENKIRYWMAKGGIKARSLSDATYFKRNPRGNPFKIINKINTPKNLMLFFVTLGLYLGEGTKKGKSAVALANTDPGIHKTFLHFLRTICQVNESKITAELNIFDDVDKQAAIKYWCKNVGISKDQIVFIIVRKSRGGNYKIKSKYGTLTTKVYNSKLKKIILSWCEMALKDASRPCSSVGRAFPW